MIELFAQSQVQPQDWASALLNAGGSVGSIFVFWLFNKITSLEKDVKEIREALGLPGNRKRKD